MAGNRGIFILPDGSSNGTTPINARLALAGLLASDGTGAFGIQQGVIYDGLGAVVSGNTDTGASISYSVRAAKFALYLTGVASSGTVVASNDAVFKVITTAAPGSNSRIDVIWVRQHAVASDGGPDADNVFQLGVTQGTASGIPIPPSIPTGAMAIAQALMTSGATNTNTLTYTQTHKWTTGAGSAIPVRNSTEQTALTGYAGMLTYRIDLDAGFRYNGTAWEREGAPQPPLSNGHQPRRILTRTTTFTVNDSVNQTVGGWGAGGAGGDDGDTTGIVLSSSGGTSNLLTFAKGGLYRVTFANAFAANATGLRQAAIWKNPTFTGANITGGTRVKTVSSPASNVAVNTVLVYGEVVLADGDTLAVSAFQSSGAGLLSGSTVDGSEYWDVVRADDA